MNRRNVLIAVVVLFVMQPVWALTKTENRWLQTLEAVWAVESGRQLNPKDGDGGKAVGPLQIWRVRVDDCNRIVGQKKWTYEDRRDWIKSAEMFHISCMHYWPNGTAEQWARHWNGSPTTGPTDKNTLGYWHKVQKELKGNDR